MSVYTSFIKRRSFIKASLGSVGALGGFSALGLQSFTPSLTTSVEDIYVVNICCHFPDQMTPEEYTSQLGDMFDVNKLVAFQESMRERGLFLHDEHNFFPTYVSSTYKFKNETAFELWHKFANSEAPLNHEYVQGRFTYTVTITTEKNKA